METTSITNEEALDVWVTDFMTERTGAEGTKRTYMAIFAEFDEWTRLKYGCSAAGIIRRTIKTWKIGTKPFAELVVKKYFQYLISQDREKYKGTRLKRNSAKSQYGAMRSFFRSNNILFIGKTPEAHAEICGEIPPKTDIIKAYKFADFDEKLRLGAVNDTGLRPSDIVNLTIRNLLGSYRKRTKRAYIKQVSEKRPIKFATCFSLQTTELLWRSLDLRKDAGEELTDASPLFARKNDAGKPIGENQLYRDVVAIGKRVGIKLIPKMFRKRFRTYGTPIIGKEHILKMAAWKIPGVGESYVLPPEEKTRELYAKLEPTLSLEEVPRGLAVEIQRHTAKELLKAAGLDPDELLRKANIGESVEDQTRFLNKTLVGTLRRSALMDPAKEIGKIIVDAVKYAKEGRPDG